MPTGDATGDSIGAKGALAAIAGASFVDSGTITARLTSAGGSVGGLAGAFDSSRNPARFTLTGGGVGGARLATCY